MSNQERYLTTKEVAAELGVSVPTIYKYVREEKLKPIYEDKWQIDDSLLFAPAEVEKVKAQEKRPPGLTTGEVAKELGVHATTVSSYIQKGLLKATKHQYKGRQIYFVLEDDLNIFKQQNLQQRQRESKDFYSKEKNLYLYQTLINQTTSEIARIIELSRENGKILKEDGQLFPLNELERRGFKAKERFRNRNHSTKRGYAKFRFEKPSHIESPVYKIIELFYRESGYKNIRLYEEDDSIVIEVKPLLIKSLSEEEHYHEIKMLQSNMIEGKITVRHNGVLIDSELEQLTIYIHYKLKNSIQNIAKDKHITMDDYVSDLLKGEVEKEGMSDDYE